MKRAGPKNGPGSSFFALQWPGPTGQAPQRTRPLLRGRSWRRCRGCGSRGGFRSRGGFLRSRRFRLGRSARPRTAGPGTARQRTARPRTASPGTASPRGARLRRASGGRRASRRLDGLGRRAGLRRTGPRTASEQPEACPRTASLRRAGRHRLTRLRCTGPRTAGEQPDARPGTTSPRRASYRRTSLRGFNRGSSGGRLVLRNRLRVGAQQGNAQYRNQRDTKNTRAFHSRNLQVKTSTVTLTYTFAVPTSLPPTATAISRGNLQLCRCPHSSRSAALLRHCWLAHDAVHAQFRLSD